MKKIVGILMLLPLLLGGAAARAVTTEEPPAAERILHIHVGETLLTATLEENSSADALVEMLSKGPVSIDMRDYANMEKVGTLPYSLPAHDAPIDTGAGDLILYQGNAFVIYYDTNFWSLTRLGKINETTRQELMDILGGGEVTVVLSLPDEEDDEADSTAYRPAARS